VVEENETLSDWDHFYLRSATYNWFSTGAFYFTSRHPDGSCEVLEVKCHSPFIETGYLNRNNGNNSSARNSSGRGGVRDSPGGLSISDRGAADSVATWHIPQLQLHILCAGLCGSYWSMLQSPLSHIKTVLANSAYAPVSNASLCPSGPSCTGAVLVSLSATKGANIFRVKRDDEVSDSHMLYLWDITRHHWLHAVSYVASSLNTLHHASFCCST
jgi:hypothetical protein